MRVNPSKIASHPQILSYFNLLLMLSIFCIFLTAVVGQEPTPAEQDTLLEKFNIEQLLEVKDYLEKYRKSLMQERALEQQRGIELSKDFLDRPTIDIDNQDKILVRVAEYYIDEEGANYEIAVQSYNKAYDDYEKKLEDFQTGKLKVEPVAPKFPRRNYEKAISIYDIILINFPESDLADDALYNKAYLLRDMAEEEASREVYQELIDKFPESDYTAEAYMHLAEYYFQPRLGQGRDETIRNLNKASQLYKNILKYKDSPRYPDALYKLGWTYYRLAADNPQNYNDAILYFTLVVQDVEKFQELDPEGKYVKSNIKPEALQYIAACFVDTAYTQNGVERARKYVDKLGTPSYGVNILENMGDLYARIVDYDKSISVYATLLEIYPDYAFAPLVQKKIADVYVESQNFDQGYNAREQLFATYNPKTEWYSRIELSDLSDRILILDQATQYTEEALRSNIIFQLNNAEQLKESKGDSLQAYNDFSRLAKLYLETYPTHPNAYEINWSLAFILDTELGRLGESFEEYLRVSNDYLEDAHRLDAANNAIVVAQSLSDATKVGEDMVQIGGVDIAQIPAEELTEEEKMLSEAYDNFIKLFPENERTASYLASAGALYYSHRQYDLARKYYKTMVTRFPEAQQRSVGLLSLMNSYFFLGKYSDAEFVAKKILELPDVGPEQTEVARKRIGESIYKNAEKLEQEETYLEAAQEFFRVYTDAPYYAEIVDLALFNSARNYELREEWLQAIGVYDTLVANYQESQYRLVGLGRIADNYKQLEDFRGVGSTYERIHRLYPDHEDAEAALYNASLFYAKSESWSDAIRVNNTYIQKYPENPDSKDLLFENARYYLKLDNLASANQIYDQFTLRYPDDSRTIEAFFRRGEYYFENDQFALAKQEFQKAISRSDQFARTGRDPNVLFASESHFMLGEIEYTEYKGIKLSYPESNVRAQLSRKQDKLRNVVNAYTTVIKMGSLKGFEAMYKVAEAYQEMADAVAEQELSPNLTPERRLVESDKVFKASVPAYDRAVEEYKNVIEQIPIYAEKLDISLFDTTATQQTSEMVLGDTTSIIQKEAFDDSTRETALRWYNQSQVKISSMLYTVADRSGEFIDAYLRQQNPAQGLVFLSWKKLLLERAVAPAVNVTLNSHLKNIKVSKELGLENKFVTESERKILLTSDILADEYGKLFNKSVDLYENQIPTLYELVDGGEQATTPDGLNSLDYNDQLMSTIDYMNEFISVALVQYQNTLKFAHDNSIENDAVLTTQDRLFNLSYESGSRMLNLKTEVAGKRSQYETLADSTGDPKYQLGIVYLYDQESILEEYAKRQMELAYQTSKDYEIRNVWTNLILARLVELSPADYLGDFPKEISAYISDASWKASTDFDMEWNLTQFDDTQWQNAAVVEIPFDMIFLGFDSLQTKPGSIWLYLAAATADTLFPGLDYTPQPELEMAPPDSVAPDRPRSLDLEEKEIPDEAVFTTRSQVPGSTDALGVAEPDTVTAYFRKKFIIQDRVVNGWALITADNDYHFYLNGEYIKGDDTKMFESVDRVEYIEISDFLNTGENTIAIDVTDFNGPPHLGLKFYLQLEMLPVEITAAAERIRRKAAENVDENRLRKVVILNKNRILSQ
jgi:tetratricopeptide (TPR) repeat protein